MLNSWSSFSFFFSCKKTNRLNYNVENVTTRAAWHGGKHFTFFMRRMFRQTHTTAACITAGLRHIVKKYKLNLHSCLQMCVRQTLFLSWSLGWWCRSFSSVSDLNSSSPTHPHVANWRPQWLAIASWGDAWYYKKRTSWLASYLRLQMSHFGRASTLSLFFTLCW